MTAPGRSLLAEVARHVGLPEAVQVEEPLGQTARRRHVGPVAAVGQRVAAAQTEPLAELLVQLRVRRQPGLVSAERVRGSQCQRSEVRGSKGPGEAGETGERGETGSYRDLPDR